MTHYLNIKSTFFFFFFTIKKGKYLKQLPFNLDQMNFGFMMKINPIRFFLLDSY